MHLYQAHAEIRGTKGCNLYKEEYLAALLLSIMSLNSIYDRGDELVDSRTSYRAVSGVNIWMCQNLLLIILLAIKL
jgi:hypothetical protein